MANKKYRTTFTDLNKFPMHKRPYSDNYLMSMPRRKLIEYIRDIEHNYEVLYEFYQNSIKYGEDLQAKLKKELDQELEEEVKFEDRKQQMAGMISKKEAMSHITNQFHQWGDDYDVLQAIGDLEDMEPVDAMPIEFIRKEIDFLQLASDYELEANGGYKGDASAGLFELKKLLSLWENEKEKQNDIERHD